MFACAPPAQTEIQEGKPDIFDPPPWIEKMPIQFSHRRVEWTKEYLRKHYGIRTDSIRFEPKIIIIHWTASRGLSASWKIFDTEQMHNGRPLLKKNGKANVSVPYLVDRDGKIVQMMREDFVARHVVGLNYSAIGIENIGGTKHQMFLTQNQIDANIKLIRYLKNKYPTIQYVIGHREYLAFKETNNPLWLEKVESYLTYKTDPDFASLKKIREAIKDLHLYGPPGN
ncbi:MAG: peptidoglycan recognition family protein [Leptospirales bacterium]